MLANGTDRKTASRKVECRVILLAMAAAADFYRGEPVGRPVGAQGEERTARDRKGPSPIPRWRSSCPASGPGAGGRDADGCVDWCQGGRTVTTQGPRLPGRRLSDQPVETQAGIREVPQHSGLAAFITRRTQGKPDTARLFPEPGEVKEGRERSMAVSKRFGHYRKRLGVDDRIEGRRQSRIDLHSFRRWFVTVTRQAGIDRAVVAACVGHEAHDMTDGTYSGGPSLEQRRACVEAVRLPVE